MTVDAAQVLYQRDGEAIIGAAPYGAGLKEWVKRSPEFNEDRISVTVQVVARPGTSLLGMWEIYATRISQWTRWS